MAAPLHCGRSSDSGARARENSGRVAGTTMLAVPVPDSALRVAGSVLDQAGPYLPFNTPFTAAGMQYYTQMPESDDSPSEKN